MFVVVAVGVVVGVEHGLDVAVEGCEVLQVSMSENGGLNGHESLADALILFHLPYAVGHVLALAHRLGIEHHLLLRLVFTVVEGSGDLDLAIESQRCVERTPDAAEDDGTGSVLHILEGLPVNA